MYQDDLRDLPQSGGVPDSHSTIKHLRGEDDRFFGVVPWNFLLIKSYPETFLSSSPEIILLTSPGVIGFMGRSNWKSWPRMSSMNPSSLPEVGLLGWNTSASEVKWV